MISPVSLLTTSSGIFSPSRMLLSASVSCSRNSSIFVLYSSSISLACRFSSVAEVLASLVGLLLGRDLHVHDDAVGAGRDVQRGVLHVGGLLAEDGAQQALLGSEFGFALGRDLADQDVAGLHLGADANDAVGAEVLQRLLAHVRDVARDFLGPELGVAGADLELLDVDRGEDVLLDDLLADEDGVLEVVAVPRHEGDQHVAAQGQFAALGAGAVGDDLALLDRLALLDDDFWLMQVAALERMNLRSW